MELGNSQHTNRLRLTAVTVAASAALTACTSVREGTPTPPIAAHRAPTPAGHDPTAPPPPPHTEQLSCPAPAANDIRIADQLLRQPAAKPVANYFGGRQSATSYYQRQAAFDRTQARKYDVTESEFGPLIESLSNTLYDGPQRATINRSVIRSAQAAIASYGVNLELTQPDKQYFPADTGVRPLTSSEQLSRRAAEAALGVLQSFDRMPREFFRLIGEKAIILGGGKRAAFAGYALTDPHVGSIVLNIDEVRDFAGTTDHETAHLWQAALCGTTAASKDPGFTALAHNARIYDYYTGPKQHRKAHPILTYTYDDYENSENLFLQREATFLDRHDTAGYCRMVAYDKRAARNVLTVSYYHPNSLEDGAEVAKYLLQPSEYARMANPHVPVIYNEFKYQMARQLGAAPNIARYMAAISTRPYQYLLPNTPHC